MLRAALFNLHSVSPFPATNGQQQRERDWLVITPQPDGCVIFMVFVAPQTEFDRLQTAYEEMLKELEVLGLFFPRSEERRVGKEC